MDIKAVKLRVTVIVVVNVIDDPRKKPGWIHVSFNTDSLQKSMNPSVLQPAADKL